MVMKDWTRWTIPNGKYDLDMQKKILSKIGINEFNFIETFCKNYKLREGVGIKNILLLFLGEYKIKSSKALKLYQLNQGIEK